MSPGQNRGCEKPLTTIAFYLLFIGILTTIYMVIALRTNIVFVIIFLFLDLALYLLAAAYWTLAEGNTALGAQLEVVSGREGSGVNDVLTLPIGCWCLRLCFLYGRLVSAHCAAHAGCRLPALTSSGRFEHQIPGRSGKTQGERRYREERVKKETISVACELSHACRGGRIETAIVICSNN